VVLVPSGAHKADFSTNAEVIGVVRALVAGSPVIIFDDDREEEGDLAFPACACTPDLVNMCLEFGRGLLCAAISSGEAARLEIDRLPRRGTDPFDTPFGSPVGVHGMGTGVSAQARAGTIAALGSPSCRPSDLVVPGHVPTLIGHAEGLSGRRGHTEAILFLLEQGRLGSVGVLCEILNSGGEVARVSELYDLARILDLPLVRMSAICDFHRAAI
jgi:3,4-dihydroxy 2-butanone 4-phosphate synthase/GTP cyclohydrolase II